MIPLYITPGRRVVAPAAIERDQNRVLEHAAASVTNHSLIHATILREAGLTPPTEEGGIGGVVMSGLSRWEPSRTTWNPWRDLEEVEKRLASMWGRPPLSKPESGKEAMTVAEWAPLVDICEDEKEYVIKAELPDVKKEEVKISVEDDVITIAGERKSETEEKGKKFHRVERSYGSFVRSFTLPEDADGSKVSAQYKDGMLHVHLPKSAKAKPKAIEVKVS